jgi:hypothetical protein
MRPGAEVGRMQARQNRLGKCSVSLDWIAHQDKQPPSGTRYEGQEA